VCILWRVGNRLGRQIGEGVPLDKNEGVVKRHFFSAMLCKHRWDLREVEDRSSETLTVNQLSAALTNRSFRQPSIQSPTAAMILLSEPRFASRRERSINTTV
jgi:hypothetical protein